MTARCIVLAAVTLASSAAFAEPKPDICNQFPQLRGNILGFVVDGDEATFELPVHPLITTVVEFSSEVTDYAAPAGLDARHAAYPWSMSLIPSATSRGTMDFETRAHKVHFTIRLVDDPADATSRAIVWQRTKDDAGKPAVQVLGRIVCNGDETPPQRTRSVIPGADNAVTERVLDESVCDLLNHQGNVVRLHDRLPDDQAIGILARQYVRLGAKGYLRLELINREVVPFEIGTVQLFDQNRTPIAPSAIRIRAATDASSELMGIIPARNSVVGTIAVADADLLTESFSLMVSEPDGGRTIWRDGIRLDDLIPSPTTGDTIKLYTRPDGVDVWEFNPPDDNEGRLGIHIQAIGGIIWLGDGLKQDLLDPTSLKGLSVRVSYGLHRLFNVETEITGASSGEASFDNMTYNNMEGTLRRSASLGRIQFAGVLRLGEKIIPHLRLGLGLQGASYDSMLRQDSGTMTPGPASDIEVDGLWHFGGGLDIRLGRYLSAGIAAAFQGLLYSDTRGVEAGIHLGYAWKP